MHNAVNLRMALCDAKLRANALRRCFRNLKTQQTVEASLVFIYGLCKVLAAHAPTVTQAQFVDSGLPPSTFGGCCISSTFAPFPGTVLPWRLMGLALAFSRGPRNGARTVGQNP